MEARKGVMLMKLVRAFIAFVVVSLFVGIGSAFNDQSSKTIEKINNPVEIIETQDDVEEISTKNVDKETIDQPVEQVEANNSFSASKDEKVENKKQEVKQTETKIVNNQTTAKEVVVQENKQPVEEKQETPKTNTQVEEKSSADNSSNDDDKINATYYSITKGIAEYDTESSCKSAGLSIQNKELDSILDWNEDHPDNPKSRTIGSSMCIIVMKNGKEYWFLHFLTISGENLDNELKSLYR